MVFKQRLYLRCCDYEGRYKFTLVNIVISTAYTPTQGHEYCYHHKAD